MKYIDLLKTLLAFGPKLAEVWPLILQALELFKAIAAKLKPELAAEGDLQIVDATAEEADLEAQLSLCLSAPGSQAAFDGSRLRKLIAILQQLPELAGIFTGLLGGLGKLFPAG